MGQGSYPVGLWFPLTPKAGPPVPRLAGSHFLSLSPTDSQRFLSLKAPSLAQPVGDGSERSRWWGLRAPPRAGSRRGRAAAPARGEARPRGPRAARQAARASPLPPRLSPGAHPSFGRGARSRPAPSAPTACAPARERCPAVTAAPSPRTLSRAPAKSLYAEGPRPRPPNLWGPDRASLARRPR